MAISDAKEKSLDFPFTKILIFFLFIRLALMAFLPVLGDEAYYFYWGMHPAGGYYDLPPMIGWWIAPFAKISLAPLWLRLPNLISLLLISASIYEWLSHGISKLRAKWVAFAFFLLPLPFLGVVMFPDIPLLFLSYFSAYLFFRAVTVRNGSALSFLFSGALLGAAFLSKYFAAFLLPAYLIWFFSQPKTSWNIRGLFFFILGGLPFAFQHYLWNQNHCWANFVFNFVTRQNVSDGPRYQIIGFFILNALLVGSPFIWSVLREKIKLDSSEDSKNKTFVFSLSSFLAWLWIIPLAIFSITAMGGRGQGLHWLLFVLPFFVMWCGLRLDRVQIGKSLKVLASLTGAISIIALAASLFPGELLKPFFKDRFQFEYTLLTHREEFIQSLLPEISSGGAIFTEGYTFSSILNYDLQRFARAKSQTLPEFSVWGAGSRFGRVFDWTTNFTALDGKKIIIVSPGFVSGDVWPQYFSNFKGEKRDFHGTHFYVSTGENFNAKFYYTNEYRHPIETYYRKSDAPCTLWDLTHP